MAYKGGFKEIVVESKKVKGLSVSLNWDCGEGRGGDYDEDDEDDVPLLRFDVSKRISKVKAGRGYQAEDLQDSSFCTLLMATDDRKLLTQAVKWILADAERLCSVNTKGGFEYHWKRQMELNSYLRIEAWKVVGA